LFLIFRIAIGMPLQGGLAVGGLYFFDGSGSTDAENFVEITLVGSTHVRFVKFPFAQFANLFDAPLG
jgi:hypothetical protein